MAGPSTTVLCEAMESLGLERKEKQGPPGSGVAFGVTDKTLEKLRGVHKDHKTVVVEDSGKVVIT